MRYISYTCPVCCASMLETDAMEQERLSEIERLQEAVTFLVAALKKVQTRPGVESAFIAAVNLEHAHKVYGVDIKAANPRSAPRREDGPHRNAEHRDRWNRERGWVKCSERMPSHEDEVLVFRINKNGAPGNVTCARWIDPYKAYEPECREEWEHGSWWRVDWSFEPEEVTHWMPMPDGPAV